MVSYFPIESRILRIELMYFINWI